MIVVEVHTETTDSGNKILVTSHGIDTTNDQVIPLPQEHPAVIGAAYDPLIGEWVL